MEACSPVSRDNVTADGVLMLTLGSLLFMLIPLMVYPPTERIGYRAAVVATTAALCLGGMLLGRSFLAANSQVRLTYILVVELSLVAWLAVWAIRSLPLALDLLLVLAGAHGLLWGIRMLRLATRLKDIAPFAAVLVSLLGASTSAGGIAIAVESSLTRMTALTLLACYAVYIGVVLTSLELWLYRLLLTSTSSPARLPTRHSIHVSREEQMSYAVDSRTTLEENNDYAR